MSASVKCGIWVGLILIGIFDRRQKGQKFFLVDLTIPVGIDLLKELSCYGGWNGDLKGCQHIQDLLHCQGAGVVFVHELEEVLERLLPRTKHG